MDQSLMMALSVAGNKLATDPGDAGAAAASAAQIVCSSISAAAASGYRPSDRWLQQAWQLLQDALRIAAGEGSLPEPLAEAQLGAAYATAVTFGFASTEVSDCMNSTIGKPPDFTYDECGYCASYYHGNSWLQWLCVLAAADMPAPGYQLCAKFASFCTHEPERSALEDDITRASPQLQAEVLLMLGTPAMIEAMFMDDYGQLPRAACAGLLGALAEGLSRAGDDSSSSSSTKGGVVFSQVSTEVLLQLVAAMPVLLRSITKVITPDSHPLDVNYTGAAGYGYDTQEMLEAACKLSVLAQRIAACTSSISPAHASTAQLVQLDQALDALLQAFYCLAEVMSK
jgi:hypothetical protein